MVLKRRLAAFHSRAPRYQSPSDARYRLYRQARVIRTGRPFAAGSGVAIRSTSDRRGVGSSHGETPPIRHVVVESITPLIAFGVHASPVADNTSDQTVSPTSGR